MTDCFSGRIAISTYAFVDDNAKEWQSQRSFIIGAHAQSNSPEGSTGGQVYDCLVFHFGCVSGGWFQHGFVKPLLTCIWICNICSYICSSVTICVQAWSRKKRVTGKTRCILSPFVESSWEICQVQKLHEGNGILHFAIYFSVMKPLWWYGSMIMW